MKTGRYLILGVKGTNGKNYLHQMGNGKTPIQK